VDGVKEIKVDDGNQVQEPEQTNLKK